MITEPGSHDYQAREPQLLKPAQPRARAPKGEATTVRSPQPESSPTTRESVFAARKTQQSQKQILFFKKEHMLWNQRGKNLNLGLL